MIIDYHAHLFHPKWYPKRFNDELVYDFIRRSGKKKSFGEIAANLFKLLSDENGEMTLRIMDKVGIDKRNILVVDWGLELGEAEKSIVQIHEEILKICRNFNDRLSCFAGVDPRRNNAKELVEWAFDKMGAKGLKLHPTGGWKLTEHRTLEIVEMADSRNLPVIVHIGKTIKELSDKNAQPASLIKLAKIFPKTIFVAGHSGFTKWRAFVDARHIPENIYFDISGWQELGDKVERVPTSALSELIQAFPGHVIFGTDSPFYTYNLIPSEMSWIRAVKQFIETQTQISKEILNTLFFCPTI